MEHPLEVFIRAATPSAALLVALGGALLLVAWRGVRRGAPTCRGCGYELVGADRSRPCPECGRSLSRRRALRHRTSRRLWLMAAAALFMLVVGAVILGLRAEHGWPSLNWHRGAPTWLLRMEASTAGEARTRKARAVMLERWRSGRDDADALLALVERGPRQFDVRGGVLDDWRVLVEELWEAGVLPPGILDAELARLIDSCIAVEAPAAVAPGEPVPLRVTLGASASLVNETYLPRGGGRTWLRRILESGGLRLIVEAGSIGAQPIEPGGEAIEIRPMPGGSSYGIAATAPVEVVPSLVDPSQPSELRLALRFEAGPPEAPWATWTRQSVHAVCRGPLVAATPVTDASRAPHTAVDWSEFIATPGSGVTSLVVDMRMWERRVEGRTNRRPMGPGVVQIPVGVIGAAYEVFGTHDGSRRRLGILRGDALRGASLEWQSPHPSEVWPDATAIDLELVPSAEIARTVPGLESYWGEPIRIEGVSIAPMERVPARSPAGE